MTLIERLRIHLKDYAAAVEAAARIEQLEAALREILDIGDASSGSDWGDLTLSRDIARAAIDQKAST